jgi:hypothetical protein
MSYRTCNYPKSDGVPCGSPALRDEKFCYFHHRDHKRSKYSAAAIRRAEVLGPRLPRMKSLAEIQAALYKVMNAIIDHRVSYQRAGRILFDLQQAAAPMRQPEISRATP